MIAAKYAAKKDAIPPVTVYKITNTNLIITNQSGSTVMKLPIQFTSATPPNMPLRKMARKIKIAYTFFILPKKLSVQKHLLLRKIYE